MGNLKSNNQSLTQKTLLAAACLSGLLAFLKLFAFLATGSLLVLASFLDSIADTFTSFINRYVNKISTSDPDQQHPFGHGGYEVIASLIQGLIIGFFGISLMVESFRSFWWMDEGNFDFSQLDLAILAMSFSALGGFLIQHYIGKQLRRLKENNERSLALEADYMHYLGDVWVNITAAMGLLGVYFTQRQELDIIFGIIASLALLFSCYPILKKAYKDIVHSEAPVETQQTIVDIVMATDEKILGVHALRSREFGPYFFVDFHMKVLSNLTLIQAHQLSDTVEKNIKTQIPKADVIIHIDPDSEPDHSSWQPSYKVE